MNVLWGVGNGTFAARVTYPAGKAPYAVTLGDMSSDGRLDVINTNYDSNTFAVLLNGGPMCSSEWEGVRAGQVPGAAFRHHLA